MEVNLLGPSRVAAGIAAVADARRSAHPESGPTHLVTVSTAYVAGTHQGEATETLFTDAMRSGARARTHSTVTTDVDIAAEIESARRLRRDLESESRRPEPLGRFTKAAPRRAGRRRDPRAGRTGREAPRRLGPHPAGRGRPGPGPGPRLARRLRLHQGPGRAGPRRTGHPDVPITVVRPSIIESALAEPRPGWIRGFRMAEPIIISYARGLLKEFPGVPEGVVDVIPVDMVVAALIAVAAAGPDPEGASVYQVASSVRNPLRYGQLVELVQSWFTEHPLYDSDGQPIVVPEWSFPGRGRVQRQLRRATTAFAMAERVLDAAARARGAGRPGGADRGSARPGRTGPRLRGALRRLLRDRGPLPHRPSPRAVGQAVSRRASRRSVSTPG